MGDSRQTAASAAVAGLQHIDRCQSRQGRVPVACNELGILIDVSHLDDPGYQSAREQRIAVERQRCEIENRLERIAELCAWGDLTREANLAERNRLQERLTGLRGATVWAIALTHAAGFLRDLPAGWRTAIPEQGNDMARLIIQRIEIEDDRVVAVVPQEDFAPFFVERHQREHGGHGNTPDEVEGVNREIDGAEATGIGVVTAS